MLGRLFQNWGADKGNSQARGWGDASNHPLGYRGVRGLESHFQPNIQDSLDIGASAQVWLLPAGMGDMGVGLTVSNRCGWSGIRFTVILESSGTCFLREMRRQVASMLREVFPPLQPIAAEIPAHWGVVSLPLKSYYFLLLTLFTSCSAGD